MCSCVLLFVAAVVVFGTVCSPKGSPPLSGRYRPGVDSYWTIRFTPLKTSWQTLPNTKYIIREPKTKTIYIYKNCIIPLLFNSLPTFSFDPAVAAILVKNADDSLDHYPPNPSLTLPQPFVLSSDHQWIRQTSSTSAESRGRTATQMNRVGNIRNY